MPLTAPRRRAALALATVVMSLVAIVVPLVVIAVAQVAPTVTILNPSDYARFGQEPEDPRPPQISDRPTGVDEADDPQEGTYRLVATAGNVPPNAALEFEVAQGPINITVGTAQSVANDTFELNWDISAAGLTDGQYVLRAILYSGDVEVARDEQDVLILNGNPQANTQVPTVDLDYPLNGQPAGIYTHPISGRTNMLVDFEYSEGTTFVEIFYTLSDPGDEPVWKRCAFDFYNSDPETSTAGEARLQCVLESQDQGGGSVTGIAALANDTQPDPVFGFTEPDSNFNRSGDAVRIFPYAQDPSTLTVDRLTVRTDTTSGTFACSAVQTVTLEDQLGRVVGGANVDVHATGPSDQLKFNTGGRPFFGGGPATAQQPPDKGHGTELGRACNASNQEQTQFARRQGDHNRALQPDIKHIEAAAAGTGSTGRFGTNLWTDRAGGTLVTFWADEDDDDVYCSEEPAAAASIGWNQNAPDPVLEVPEKTICPVPVPPPPGSSTGPDPSNSTTSTPTDPRGCTIEGTEGDDQIPGTEEDDVICAKGGDDVIIGSGGNDTIYGDAGEDRIRGGAGNDVIDGGFGDDSALGDSGDDAIDGAQDNDVVDGGPGNDTLRGQAGFDSLKGRGGRDVLRGGQSDDVLFGGGQNDFLYAWNGADLLRGGGGNDILRGGRHNDQLEGGRGNDTLDGGAGTDQCRGGPGRTKRRRCER